MQESYVIYEPTCVIPSLEHLVVVTKVHFKRKLCIRLKQIPYTHILSLLVSALAIRMSQIDSLSDSCLLRVVVPLYAWRKSSQLYTVNINLYKSDHYKPQSTQARVRGGVLLRLASLIQNK